MPDSTASTSQPDAARGIFLGDLAHDLSTPLTAIHGATELLLAGTYGPIEGEQRALMLEVLASARDLRAETGASRPPKAGWRDAGRGRSGNASRRAPHPS